MAKSNPALIVVGGLIGVVLLFGIIGAVMYKPAYEVEGHHAEVEVPPAAVSQATAAENPATVPITVITGSEEEVFVKTYWNMFLAGLGEQPEIIVTAPVAGESLPPIQAGVEA